MVASQSRAQVTFPFTLVKKEPSMAMQEATWAILVAALLETKLLQPLRFQAGQVLPLPPLPRQALLRPPMPSFFMDRLTNHLPSPHPSHQPSCHPTWQYVTM